MKREKIVFIHGLGASNEDWRDWACQEFGNNYEVKLVGLPGHKGMEAIQGKEFEDWVAFVQGQIGDEKCHLVGWSLGGVIAYRIAVTEPNKVLSLNLLGTMPSFGSFSVLSLGWRLAKELVKSKRTCLRRVHLKSLFHGACIAAKVGRAKEQKSREHAFNKVLARCNVKVSWIFGGEDALVSEERIISLGKVYGHSVKKISGVSHFLHLEAPKLTAKAIMENIKS